jgi:hypothetical protein
MSARDLESGMASSTRGGTVNLVENTQGVTHPRGATNGAGLLISVPVSWKLDKDRPVAMLTVTGMLGLNGWSVSDVLVKWTLADATSGVASSSGCSPVVLKQNTVGAPMACEATKGA